MLTDSTSTTSADVNPATVLVDALKAANETPTERRKRLTDTFTCEIVLTRERALAAFRAAADFMCEDTTRMHLCGIAISLVPANELNGYQKSAGLQLVSTDGLTLARVRVPTADVGNAMAMPDDHRDTPIIGRADVATLIRALTFKRKVDGSMPVTIALARPGSVKSLRTITVRIGADAPLVFHSFDLRFPPYEHVIPPRGRTPKGAIGFNPEYVVRAADAARILGRPNRATTGMMMECGDALDPILFTWADRDCEIGDLLVVVMPMRR